MPSAILSEDKDEDYTSLCEQADALGMESLTEDEQLLLESPTGINIKEEIDNLDSSLIDEGLQRVNTLPAEDKIDSGLDEKGLAHGNCNLDPPAEDKELTELKKYILDNGFNEAGVAMHVVMLCSQPLVTPRTTGWDFVDRASIPNMVLTILKTPGYLEGIWPSLRIVMATNKGNTAWTANIAITLAYFDCIRTIPALVAIKNDS